MIVVCVPSGEDSMFKYPESIPYALPSCNGYQTRNQNNYSVSIPSVTYQQASQTWGFITCTAVPVAEYKMIITCKILTVKKLIPGFFQYICNAFIHLMP